ncbi:MAG: hypothetical protein ACXVJW_13015 [Acidimicrobiia bacterium]
MHAVDTPAETRRAPRLAGRARGLAIVGLGLALGLGAALGPRVLDDAHASTGDAAPPSGAVPLASLSTRQVAAASSSAGAAVAAPSAQPDPAGAPAASPRAAIDAFLTAETDGAYDTSYGLLSAADRTRVGGRAAWTSSHANLPPVTGYTIESVEESGPDATVVTATDLRASLDDVIGLVPAHATATWIAVQEDGGWRVAYSRSRLAPRYPAESLAVDAAREWVTARQSCRHAAEWTGGVLGPTFIGRRLCHASGPAVVGAPTELLDDPAGDVTAAFGPDVYSWARLVPVTGPARLDLVVAPVGERWLVIGVREASPGTR